jgi:hypothetical protein
MLDIEMKKVCDKMLEIFDDELVNPEQEPRRFEYQIRVARFILDTEERKLNMELAQNQVSEPEPTQETPAEETISDDQTNNSINGNIPEEQ